MKEILKVKLQNNKERIIRGNIIQAIPEKYKSIFTKRGFQYSHDVIKNIDFSFMPKFDKGILLTKKYFSKYFYIDYDQPEHVIECLNHIQYNIKYGAAVDKERNYA